MSEENLTSSTSSKPSTDHEAARITVQTDYRHHSIPVPDKVNHEEISAESNLDDKVTNYLESKPDRHGPASPEQVAHRSKN